MKKDSTSKILKMDKMEKKICNSSSKGLISLINEELL